MAQNPYGLKCSVPPAAEPLNLAEAKLYLRVDGGEEDALISDMIVAVREAAEEYLRKSLITRTWVMTHESYAPSCIRLPKGPVQTVGAIVSRDSQGQASTVDAGLYHLSPVEDAVHLESVVMGHAVEITYVAGYGDAEDVPASVKQGMLVHLAALYEDRLGGMELPAAAICLYKPHRVIRL